ncbi:MAG TPA: hypothetical protein VFO39_15610 [Candidatus Sulfotelmatobacter sp.]|nr:hypothetical protein [Candidatus Sulfotelmatobacter sp.]
MKVIHRRAFRLNADQDHVRFEVLGLDASQVIRFPDDHSFIVVEIAEDDPRWPKVLPFLNEQKATDFVTTEFSGSEIESASFLVMFATAHRGYPQPEKDFAYLSATYDLTELCVKCGLGLRQQAPFRLKGEPRSTNKSILQLNWVFDEFFVAPEVWETLFRPFGVGSREVVFNRTGVRIGSLVQLDITAFCDVSIGGLGRKDCPVCGRRSYQQANGRYYPAPISTSFPICKSNQLFGAHANPYRLVIVSHEVYNAVIRAGLKGVQFCPCEETPGP